MRASATTRNLNYVKTSASQNKYCINPESTPTGSAPTGAPISSLISLRMVDSYQDNGGVRTVVVKKV